MSKRAKFFNHHWKLIFDSETERRSKRIEQVCHIPQSLLWHGKKPDVAASLILSLSTTRKTTRPEDRAYSLMGILGIRMPVDYGEGADKAIWRLLEQIIKNNGDVSVFNWSGPYHGNKIPGRSLFPTDFSAYEREVVQKYPFNKPLRAHSEVTLGQSGVHARFEIWEPQIIFEDDNELSYKTIRDLDYLLDTPGRETQARLDCEVTCRCVVDGTPENDIYITAYCPRWMLREQLEVQLGIADRSHANSSWCLVRFAGVKGARWFLCQLNYGHSELNKKALFANMFGGVVKDAEVMDDNLRMVLQSKGADRFVHYLEGMGFEGVRIPTMGFEDMQEKVPVERARVLNLWVG